jgi:RsiW-degrading membrane proteinase PrsW (M82 family)
MVSIGTGRRADRGRRGWSQGPSLFRPREPAFWLFAAVVLSTGIYAASQQTVFRRISPAGWALSWLLLAVYALPVLLAVYFLRLYKREPISLVLGSFVWGAVAATTLAGLANEGWGLVVARVAGPQIASRWTAALTAPWVEETLTVAGVVLIAMMARNEFGDMLDGFVFGAVCGLGFAIVEDVFYFMGVYGGSPSGVLAGFYVRVISSGPYGHVLYTGLSGMGVAYFVSRRLAAGIGLFLAAVLGHFLWDSPWLDLFPATVRTLGQLLMVPVAAAVKGLPLLAFVVVAVVLARRRERRWLAGALLSEVGSEALSGIEFGLLLDPAAQRRSRRDMRARAGRRAARLLGRLQREQVNLAMIRSKTEREDDPDLVRQRAYCKSLRDALQAIPGAAPASRTELGP